MKELGSGEKERGERVSEWVKEGTRLVACVGLTCCVGVGVGEIGHIRVCVWRSHGELTNSSRKELGQVWCWSLGTGGSARRAGKKSGNFFMSSGSCFGLLSLQT